MAVEKTLQQLLEQGGRQVFCFQLIQRQVQARHVNAPSSGVYEIDAGIYFRAEALAVN